MVADIEELEDMDATNVVVERAVQSIKEKTFAATFAALLQSLFFFSCFFDQEMKETN